MQTLEGWYLLSVDSKPLKAVKLHLPPGRFYLNAFLGYVLVLHNKAALQEQYAVLWVTLLICLNVICHSQFGSGFGYLHCKVFSSVSEE